MGQASSLSVLKRGIGFQPVDAQLTSLEANPTLTEQCHVCFGTSTKRNGLLI